MMLKAGSDLFLQFPSQSNGRILHPTTVVAVSESGCAAELLEETPPLVAGQELVVFYEIRREFHQQSARVSEVGEGERAAEGGEPRARISLEPMGDPVSAESRQHYRVSTLSAPIRADLGGEAGCAVRDVSATGFSVVARQSYPIGHTLPASLFYDPDDDPGDSQTLAGQVCVQSTRELGTGIRYGLRFVSDGLSVADGLSRISLSVQRAQLRRR